jgi:protein-L-isoaspartate(D-aspartate) O-methyltransferase
MIDFAKSRRMMVDCQLRTVDVHDVDVLSAFDVVGREHFLIPGRDHLAYIDQDVPSFDDGDARLLLAPMTVGRCVQALEVKAGERVLDVAGGRGYAAAIMATLGGIVTALESTPAHAAAARAALDAAGIAGVSTVSGPLEAGWRAGAPYGAILVNGAVEVAPKALLDQLADGGRLVCVEGVGRSARATLHVHAGRALSHRVLFDAAAPILGPFRAAPAFVF